MYKALLELVLTTSLLLVTGPLATQQNGALQCSDNLATQTLLEPSGSRPTGGALSKPTSFAGGHAISRTAKQPLHSSRKLDRTSPLAMQAADGATTTLAGVFRYTCDDGSGFLPDQCRAELFSPCAVGGSKVALTTDSFLSLQVDIDNAQDGDTWTWNWRSPDGRLTFSARLVFHDEFNGQQHCFEFSAPFSLHGDICGSRSISFAWGSRAVHGGAEGLWFVDLSFNNQLLFHEPFELIQPPQVQFTSFSAQDLASGVLGTQVNFIVSSHLQDPGPWRINAQVLTSTSPSTGGSVDYDLQPGTNDLQIDLAQLGIGRFDDDVKLQIRITTPSPPSCPSIPPQVTSATLDIPLPLIFVHGYVEGSLRFSFVPIITPDFIREKQADPFFNYLIALSTSEQNPELGIWRIPYATQTGSYPTLSFFDWLQTSDFPVENITQQLQRQINERLGATYATRVNLLTHSMGGLIGRIAVSGGAPVRKLIMVGCPNNGTSFVWIRSNHYSRAEINAIVDGVVGFAIPRTDALPLTTRGPYQKNAPCSILSLPIQGRPLPPLPSDGSIKVFNIFAVNTGTETLWDLIATARNDGWYNFTPRQLRVAEGCDPNTDWASYSLGDGVMSIQDATLGADFDIRVETNFRDVPLLKGAPHAKQIGHPEVREEIARSLGVIE